MKNLPLLPAALLIALPADGLRADIIAVEGHPLEDITVLERVRFVMKEGRVYKRGN